MKKKKWKKVRQRDKEGERWRDKKLWLKRLWIDETGRQTVAVFARTQASKQGQRVTDVMQPTASSNAAQIRASVVSVDNAVPSVGDVEAISITVGVNEWVNIYF